MQQTTHYEALDAMPRELPSETTLFAEIMDRHDVTRKALAYESRLQPEHVSRCLAGQYAIPMAAWRALWKITTDPDIPAVLFNDGAYLVVPLPAASRGEVERRFGTLATRVMMKDWRDTPPGQVMLRLVQTVLQLMRAHGADEAIRKVDGRAA